jgi:hypothetical protein
MARALRMVEVSTVALAAGGVRGRHPRSPHTRVIVICLAAILAALAVRR